MFHLHLDESRKIIFKPRHCKISDSAKTSKYQMKKVLSHISIGCCTKQDLFITILNSPVSYWRWRFVLLYHNGTAPILDSLPSWWHLLWEVILFHISFFLNANIINWMHKRFHAHKLLQHANTFAIAWCTGDYKALLASLQSIQKRVILQSSCMPCTPR